MGLHVDYVYNRAKGDYKTLNINFRDPVTCVRPLPQYSRIDQIRPDADLKYQALYIKAEKRYSHSSQFLVSYTFTDSDDNNPMGRYLDMFDLGLDYGPSGGERRHAIVASGSVLLPWDITIGALYVRYRSAAAVVGDRRARPERRHASTPISCRARRRNSGSRNLNLDGGQRLSHAQRSGGDLRSRHRQLAHQHHGRARQQSDPLRRAQDGSPGAGVQRPQHDEPAGAVRRADASGMRSRTRSAASPARGRHARSSWPSARCGDARGNANRSQVEQHR